jgi:hypothetical protein
MASRFVFALFVLHLHLYWHERGRPSTPPCCHSALPSSLMMLACHYNAWLSQSRARGQALCVPSPFMPALRGLRKQGFHNHNPSACCSTDAASMLQPASQCLAAPHKRVLLLLAAHSTQGHMDGVVVLDSTLRQGAGVLQLPPTEDQPLQRHGDACSTPPQKQFGAYARTRPGQLPMSHKLR